MKWFQERFTALIDNLTWLIASTLGLALIVWLIATYRNTPEITLLWALLALGVFQAVVGVFMFSRLKGNRPPQLHGRHRTLTRKYFEEAFMDTSEIFILSIMSQHTVKEIELRLQKAQTSKTRVNILTLDPMTQHPVIEAIQLHLNEPPYDTDATARQIKEAYELWTTFAKKYSNVQVRKYHSIPTMQGILVRDKYVTVELLPFNTQFNDRPGLYLTRKDDPDLFHLFQDKFIELWDQQQQ